MFMRSPKSRKLTLQQLESRNLMAAGVLDANFGVGGITRADLGAYSTFETAYGVAAYPAGSARAGQVVAVGAAAPGSRANSDFALIRLTASGTLDPSFDGDGKVMTAFGGGEDVAVAATIVSDKILVAGHAGGDFALARYNDNGTLDSSFGNKGKVVTDFNRAADGARAMKLQSDGRIVVAGFSNGALALARYSANGALDTSFGSGGKTVVNLGESLTTGVADIDLAIYPASAGVGLADKLVVSSRSTSSMFVSRLTANGQLDTSFGAAGIKKSAGTVYTPAVTLQSDARIVLAYGDSSGDMAVTRLLATGDPDLQFGAAATSAGTGTVTLSTPNSGERASSVVIDSLGRILVGGSQSTYDAPATRNFVVVRLLGDGSPDPTYGVAGMGTSAGTISVRSASQVDAALLPDGNLVIAGGTYDQVSATSGEWSMAAARFAGDSALIADQMPIYTVTEHLTLSQLPAILAEAESRWTALGVDPSQFRNINVQITDLGGTLLGVAAGNAIYLDDNAAGWGWFIDSTPSDDSEFVLPGNQGEQSRMDLLSVVMHEMGHLLGLDHDEFGVMAEALAAGRRCTALQPETATGVDQAFGQATEHRDEAWVGTWSGDQLEATNARSKRRW